MEFIKPETAFEKDYFGSPARYENFVQDAVILKQCFDKYSRIAGIFALTLLYISTVNVIRYLNFLITQDTLEFVSNSMIFNASCFVAIGFLSSFGNYFQCMTKTWKEDLVVAHVQRIGLQSDQQVRELLLWLSTWECKLSPLDMFDMNHTTVPAVTTLAITYFVLIFQLRASENTSQKECI
ncbi:unnamed protein product [Allacma fusca]|uniref:Uncharacterized protein n=1 Tax=Allacma fusca TaxID=39272 RepID=A0A8J2L7T6_9HEXA|nr:unnamed protein product [Allacma fusca]